MIPKEIIKGLDTVEFEDDGGMLITGVEFLEGNCKIKLLLDTGDECVPDQLWEIHINNLREERICYDWFYDLQILSEHKLLEPYLKPNKELYIKSKPKHPNELLKDLYVYHNSTLGKYRQMETFFNTEKRLDELCAMEFGLFAKGPETYLNDYKAMLEKQGAEPYLFGDFKSKKWTGEEWVEDNPNMKLLLLGGTFFIADSFSFQKI